ncbi:MAG: hypothetical protein EOO06_16790 [Chitinophagaceae bacterium]|nr:MAG: hypothetical protein EOO06_16790 [Chitinophagaceae bacterium]
MVTTGYKNWLMTINGLQVGADTMNRGFTMVSTGTRIVENPANGPMGNRRSINSVAPYAVRDQLLTLFLFY